MLWYPDFIQIVGHAYCHQLCTAFSWHIWHSLHKVWTINKRLKFKQKIYWGTSLNRRRKTNDYCSECYVIMMIVFRVHCKSVRRNASILILPFHGFFNVWHGSVRENLPPWGTLKLVILPSFKVTCLKRAKLDTAQKNLRTSHLHPTTIQRFVNFHNFADLYISSLVFNKSLSNLAVLLI